MVKKKNAKNKINKFVSRKLKITDAEIRRLVIERLKTLPSGKQISIGDKGSFTKNELINRVELGDDIGKKMIEVELEFLRALKKGKLFDEQENSRN